MKYAKRQSSLGHYDGRNLADHVAEHACLLSDSLALHYLRRTFTWREVDRLACQLANALNISALQERDVVGIDLPNVPYYALILTALAKANLIGCIFSRPAGTKSLQKQVRDTNARAIFIMDSTVSLWQRALTGSHTVHTVFVCRTSDFAVRKVSESLSSLTPRHWEVRPLIDNCDSTFMPLSTPEEGTFLIQYTDPGAPAVEYSHRALVQHAQQYAAMSPSQPHERCLLSLWPPHQGVGLAMLLDTLCSGCEYIMLPDPATPEQIINICRYHTLSHIALPPSWHESLIRDADFQALDLSDLQSIQTSAGQQQSHQTWCRLAPSAQLFETFGDSATISAYTTHFADAYRQESVGMPMPGTAVRIVDPDDYSAPRPSGQSGHILVSGPQLMRSYWREPKTTRRRMPILEEKCWWVTNHHGYLDKDGYLYLSETGKQT